MRDIQKIFRFMQNNPCAYTLAKYSPDMTTQQKHLRYEFEISEPTPNAPYFLLRVKSTKSPLRKSKNNFVFSAKTRAEIDAKIEEVKNRVSLA